jgi:hypothetical protein
MPVRAASPPWKMKIDGSRALEAAAVALSEEAAAVACAESVEVSAAEELGLLVSDLEEAAAAAAKLAVDGLCREDRRRTSSERCRRDDGTSGGLKLNAFEESIRSRLVELGLSYKRVLGLLVALLILLLLLLVELSGWLLLLLLSKEEAGRAVVAA